MIFVCLKTCPWFHCPTLSNPGIQLNLSLRSIHICWFLYNSFLKFTMKHFHPSCCEVQDRSPRYHREISIWVNHRKRFHNKLENKPGHGISQGAALATRFKLQEHHIFSRWLLPAALSKMSDRTLSIGSELFLSMGNTPDKSQMCMMVETITPTEVMR